MLIRLFSIDILVLQAHSRSHLPVLIWQGVVVKLGGVMHFEGDMGCTEFPMPKSVNTVVCCDLDETYIPFNEDNQVNGGISQLESFMRASCEELGIVLGWVTGTNLSSAMRKAKGYISSSPHFVSCSLGTEFYWVREGRLYPSRSWQRRIDGSGFRKENLQKTVACVEARGIALSKQQTDYQGKWKVAYYYVERPSRDEDFAQIKRAAQDRDLRVLFAKCSPAAGDPIGAYDVEFLPLCCGKDHAVEFLQSRFGLSRGSLYGFGDGFNDFPMLDAVGNGFLVGNALAAAVERRGSSLAKPYCLGIVDVLEGLKSA